MYSSAHNYAGSQRPIFGTHKGHQCQEGARTLPGGYGAARAWAGYSCGSFLAGAGVSRRAAVGSCWSVRSRAAVRTNEHDAGEWREILEDEEGWVAVGLSGSCACSRSLAGGVVSQAPIRRRVIVLAAAVTMCPGPGCSVRRSSAALSVGSCRMSERARGLVTLPCSRPP